MDNEKLRKAFPELSINDSTYKLKIGERVFLVEYDDKSLIFSDNYGVEYDEGIYIEYNPDVTHAVIKFLQDQMFAAGFKPDSGLEMELEPDIAGVADWNELIKLINPKKNRSLLIKTYGNKFKQYRYYTGVQKKFNSLIIYSSKPEGIDLRYARGTDPEVQASVEAGLGFWTVIEEIVTAVENGNLSCIGIYCRAGHHRSVACAELLKKNIYLKANIEHLTISK